MDRLVRKVLVSLAVAVEVEVVLLVLLVLEGVHRSNVPATSVPFAWSDLTCACASSK